MRVCGIDPGAKGAMCVLDSSNPAHTELLDLSTVTTFEAANWLHKQQPDIIYIEHVHSIFGMSAKSNFSFGIAVGGIQTIALIVKQGQHPKLVTPKVWQKYVGVTAKGKAIKKNVAELVQSLYPTAIIHGKRGGLLDGRSDAIMLAKYGLEHEESP